jgi:hypothetical protein
MTNCIALDESKKKALLECESRIKRSQQSIIMGAESMGIELKSIHEDELFLATHNTWEAYINERWGMTPRWAFQLIRLGERLPEIREKTKKLGIPSPENEAQMRPLLKLPAREALDVWVKAATKAKEDKVALSQTYVELFADKSLSSNKPSDKRTARVIHFTESSPPPAPNLAEYDFDEPEQKDSSLMDYSAKARTTLGRVLELFGQEAYESVLAGVLKIPDNDLVKWGSYQDPDFEALGKYLIENRWTFRKAEDFLFQKLTGKTRCDTLINLAIARGGHLRVEINGYTIEIYNQTLGISLTGKN